MWKPCAPGVRPEICAVTTTASPSGRKETIPATLLPCVGFSTASAPTRSAPLPAHALIAATQPLDTSGADEIVETPENPDEEKADD